MRLVICQPFPLVIHGDAYGIPDIGIMIVKPDNYDHFSLAGLVARSLVTPLDFEPCWDVALESIYYY